ncbi:MAG: hypothetical protein GF383_08755 [Candidatus Lokiarchaeota archaeon]|nr:hypothetical protein [Candidatus Lokiarchaeota archaeon]MBD3340469.1 hypothetical protein [Candidatus Lokiarchaeota archaeon]
MTEDLMEELKNFLNDANLTTYETNAFVALINSSKKFPPTARDISRESEVPLGRIYDILEDLHSKGLVEIIDSRPKKYRAFPVNEALNNLISYQAKQNKREIGYLYDRAKIFESELFEVESSITKTPSRLFWSTAYGMQSIFPVYINAIKNSTEEILFNEYVSQKTTKIIPRGALFYNPIRKAINRGVRVKILWNFQLDERPIDSETEEKNASIFKELTDILKQNFQLDTQLSGFSTRFIHHKIPTLYDIFDKKRIIFKIQNPLKPYQIFTIMNVIDPTLAEKLRENYLSVWNLESID